jgi:alanine racemase
MPEDMDVGVAAIGYGDGYPRSVPSGTPVLVNGQRVPLIGRVSMDLMTIDLRTLPDAQVGDEVTLWGPSCRSRKSPPPPAPSATSSPARSPAASAPSTYRV